MNALLYPTSNHDNSRLLLWWILDTMHVFFYTSSRTEDQRKVTKFIIKIIPEWKVQDLHNLTNGTTNKAIWSSF